MTEAYEARKRWKARHPEEFRAQERRRQARRQARNRAIIGEARARPCVDCGVQYPPEVMQFDHVRGEKLFNLSRTPPALSVSRLQAEIVKCEVVCANCHALRTARRQRELYRANG